MSSRPRGPSYGKWPEPCAVVVVAGQRRGRPAQLPSGPGAAGHLRGARLDVNEVSPAAVTHRLRRQAASDSQCRVLDSQVCAR